MDDDYISDDYIGDEDMDEFRRMRCDISRFRSNHFGAFT
jgi:hypothetical protein